MKKAAFVLIILAGLVGLSFGDSNHNFGVGIIAGEPTGVSFKLWTSQTTGFDAGAAWSFVGGEFFQVHGDFLLHNYNLFRVDTGKMSLFYGVGGRLKFGEDTIGDNETTLSLRVPVGLAYEFEKTPIEIFLEVVPMLDLIPAIPISVAGAVGFRYYF
jgi:hypothetical protein